MNETTGVYTLAASEAGERAAAASAAEQVTYTTNELAMISGISKDQLTNWDRAGLLRPARRKRGRIETSGRGTGTRSLYSRDQALGVIALGELRRAGVSARRIRAASALLPRSIDRGYLVFDGRLLHTRATAEQVVKLLRAKVQDCHVLTVSELVERLHVEQEV